MLVEAMNPAEIATQVYREYSKIYFTTAQRLLKEYDRERRKLKIDKSRIYTRHYAIKTAQKNNWIVFIGKAPSKEKYKGMECANTCCIVYYYTSKGFRVFVPVSGKIFVVYNGHVFKRYNERLNLNLASTLEAAIHYFKYNGYAYQNAIEKKVKIYTIGFCKDGFLLGKLKYNNVWLEWKTFVSRNLARADQDEMENELIEQLNEYIETEIKKETTDITKLKTLQDKIKAVTGAHIQ
jgi:hypothetical protein